MSNLLDFKCVNCGHITKLTKCSFKLNDKLESVPVKPVSCEECGSETNYIKKDFSGVPYFGKFSSASDADKKRMLKKRSDAHFNKQGKEEKRERYKSVMNKYKE